MIKHRTEVQLNTFLLCFYIPRLTNTNCIYTLIAQIDWLYENPYMRSQSMVNDFADSIYVFIALKKLNQK